MQRQLLSDASFDENSKKIKITTNVSSDLNQLLTNSCTAYCCALLFSQLLKQSKPDINQMKALRLFEIAIYPMIWEHMNEQANLNKSINFLSRFLDNTKPLLISNKNEIESITSSPGDALFMVVKRGEKLHTLFVIRRDNVFVHNDENFRDLISIESDIQLVVKIESSKLNIKSISHFYEKYLREFKHIITLYDSRNSMHQYYLSCLVKCQHLFPEFEKMLERRKALTKIDSHLKTEPEHDIKSYLFFTKADKTPISVEKIKSLSQNHI